MGSLAEAFGPAARRFLRPIRVVGRGGGSYFGFFYERFSGGVFHGETTSGTNLLLLFIFIITSWLITTEGGVARTL